VGEGRRAHAGAVRPAAGAVGPRAQAWGDRHSSGRATGPRSLEPAQACDQHRTTLLQLASPSDRVRCAVVGSVGGIHAVEALRVPQSPGGSRRRTCSLTYPTFCAWLCRMHASHTHYLPLQGTTTDSLDPCPPDYPGLLLPLRCWMEASIASVASSTRRSEVMARSSAGRTCAHRQDHEGPL
jgi:hypothetical protein